MPDYTDAKNAEKCWCYDIFKDFVESGINEEVTVASMGPENEGQNDRYSEVEFMPEYTETEKVKKC